MALTLEEVNRRILEKHGKTIQLDESTFIGACYKARFVDIDFGEWWTRCYGPISGHVHPKRARQNAKEKMLLPIDEVLQRLKEKHGDNVALDTSTYVGMTKKARFIDKDFGEWWAKPGNIINAGQKHRKRAHQEKITRGWKPHNVLSLDEVKRRIQEKYGDLVEIDESSYTLVNAKARFIDKEHGEFTTFVGSVLQGVRHPNTSHDKWLQSCQKWKPIEHWRTLQQCQIQSGYEHAVLTWLNANQIDFDWQIPFETPFVDSRGIKRVYIIDLFIKSGKFTDTYVEIKGTWNTSAGKIGKQKWKWFHETHSNSLLWYEKDMIELGIFTSGKTYLRQLKKVLLK